MTNSSLAFQMFHNGIGVSEIAKKINVSKTTVYKYIDLEMDRFNERDIPNSGQPRKYNKKIWNLASGLVRHWNRWQKNITCQRKQ